MRKKREHVSGLPTVALFLLVITLVLWQKNTKNHKIHTYFIKKSEKKLKIIKKLFAFRGKVWYNHMVVQACEFFKI